MSSKLFDQIFNLKFTAKQLQRQSIKCEKDEKAEKMKAKKAMEKNNIEGARIYAQNAIRLKNDSLTYLKLASRLDGVVSRLDQQAKMGVVTKNLAGIVKNLESTVSSAQLDKVSKTMDAFEKVFDNLDVQSSTLESAMGNQMAISTPTDQVDALLGEISAEHGLETQFALPSAATQEAAPAQSAGPVKEDDLNARLAALRGA